MFRGGRRGGARFVPRHDRQAKASGEIQPPPLYPPLGDLAARDLLKRTDEWNYTYLLALKRSYRANMIDSVYHLKLPVKKNDIERYSDKYNEKSLAQKFQPDWRRLPAELCVTKKKKKKKSSPKLIRSTAEVGKKLEELEKREAEENDDDTPNKTPNEEENQRKSGDTSENDEEDKEGGESDEEGEAMESDNDYNANYYDSEKSEAEESEGEHYF